ncbi:MAG: adenylyl-sulfate reductase subunit alpha [Dehalococcoidia bacterium]|nr:adenylyl-sulfate reductase subunit alpha [Dehalococcoidia bacterium]
MASPTTEVVECDVLVIGGGMSGCGAAFEARYWGEGLRVVMVEKAAVERSGATGEGLSAINCYMGMRWGWNTPEDFVTYVVNDMMGLAREDLVYDVGRHVDATVHMWEDWGLPIWKKPDGTYERVGRWQIPIHGESIKPIVAEGPRHALGRDNIYERVLITQLLTDSRDSNRIAGAIGFGVRDGKIYVFKARAVICTAGGASNVFRPKSTSEGLGRTWYSVFDTGSVYGLVIPTGAEMTQMEHRFVPSRFKDGYGPIGMWFQFFKARATNAMGEDYTVTRADVLKEYEPYGTAVPTPTPLRNHQMFLDIMEGKGPIYIRTEEAIANLAQSDPARLEEIKAEAWEDFLDMTISQALMWAAQNIAPEDTPSEIVLAEPYIMGSHSGEAGAWVSGPDDLNGEYRWGYNRMTTVHGLFAGGDGVGAAPHKFSSGSFTEGRLAAKAAVAYVRDTADAPRIDRSEVERIKGEILRPLATFSSHRTTSTSDEINPNYILPRQGLVRLQKIMDEYAAGTSAMYSTTDAVLNRGLELLTMLREDLDHLAARDTHELMRCWELVHRAWVGEIHIRHLLHRKETRWPGYYYRQDYPKLDDANWRVFVNSRRDPETGRWDVFTRPYHRMAA